MLKQTVIEQALKNALAKRPHGGQLPFRPHPLLSTPKVMDVWPQDGDGNMDQIYLLCISWRQYRSLSLLFNSVRTRQHPLRCQNMWDAMPLLCHPMSALETNSFGPQVLIMITCIKILKNGKFVLVLMIP